VRQARARDFRPFAEDLSQTVYGPINVTMIEHINDMVFITIGPKRMARYQRVQPGVTILIEPDTGAPFGLMIVPGLMDPRTAHLPLRVTLAHHETIDRLAP
jgi:hypothetical protein